MRTSGRSIREMDATAERFIRHTNKKSTLTLLDDIKAALCIFISHYSERAFSLGSDTFIPFAIIPLRARTKSIYLKKRNIFILRWNSLVGRPRHPCQSSPIIRAASSSAWWAPAAPDNANLDSTPDCSPAAPGASTTQCRRTVLSGVLWSRVWSTPRRTSGMSCRVWVPSPGRSRRRSASRRSSPPDPDERRRKRGSRRLGSRRRDPTAIEHLHRRRLSGSTSRNHNQESRFQSGG